MAATSRQAERLDRGLVAVADREGNVHLSWRLRADDPPWMAFHVYRAGGGRPPLRLTETPVRDATTFVDRSAGRDSSNVYTVRPVMGAAEQEPSRPAIRFASGQYLTIPLRTPDGHTPGDASVGDLDGDGRYEIVIKQEQTPRDNAHHGTTGQTKLEAYTLDGRFLWRIDLGPNIREGAHYTPFIVYDLDGDGCAEIACKTADGTVDGQGHVIGDPQADYRNRAGRVLDGPEFLTLFDGPTGRALATVDYVPPRGRVRAWGDDYGNRVDRFLACVAFLDGERPSLVMCRGYYTRTVLVAWNWRDGRLTRVWTFDSEDGSPGNRAFSGQGNHSLSVGDVDGDRRDEIVYGACCIDDDGRGLYSTRLGHGDAEHLADIDPDRPGLEVFAIHERPDHPHGAELHEAASGRLIWSIPSPDVGRGLALDIDPRYRGSEYWAVGPGLDGLFRATGQRISRKKPRSCNMGVWWDGDPLRELLDGITISKWNYEAAREERLLLAEGCASNNGTKANPCLAADILGDWREEVVWRTADNRALRVYTTTIPTDRRRVTPMHDPVYRLGVANQNVGYNQPAHTGYYFGGAGEDRSSDDS